MSRFRVYLKPFDDDGVYQDDFIEITEDVIKLGNIEQGIDSNEFQVGVVRNKGLQLALRNDHGLYTEAGNLRSVFKYKRKNSIVKVTWDLRNYDLVSGFFLAGTEPLGGEHEIFQGVLNEVTSTSNINDQNASFTILSYDSLIDEIETPYDLITNGDTISEILLTSLNQTPLSDLVTVDAGNIDINNDIEIDDKADWENTTVGSLLRDVLLAGNSILYLKDQILYVTGRDPSADLKFTFYGQGSINGIENIVNVPKVRDGLNRMFNYWTWPDTTLVSKNLSSIGQYGIKEEEISLSTIVGVVKRQSVLDANKDEFALPKTELDIETPISYTTLNLRILDKVNIDYPTIHVPFDNNPLPRYGQNTYDGVSRYPFSQWALTIDSQRLFKILRIKIDTNKQTLTFGLREV